MNWEDLDEKHRLIMDELGDFSPTVNAANKEIKGYMDDGKTYWDSAYLRELAESCVAVANWLDLRAEQEDNLNN